MKKRKYSFLLIWALLGSLEYVFGLEEGRGVESEVVEIPAQGALEEDLDNLSSPRADSDLEAGFESFISFKEYGKKLYENPRGIGCNKCHGAKGDGALIAEYKYRGESRILSAPAINQLEFDKFLRALGKTKSSSPMPTYRLHPQEIKAIFYYLNNVNK